MVGRILMLGSAVWLIATVMGGRGRHLGR
jgi:hypothetical protein